MRVFVLWLLVVAVCAGPKAPIRKPSPKPKIPTGWAVICGKKAPVDGACGRCKFRHACAWRGLGSCMRELRKNTKKCKNKIKYCTCENNKCWYRGGSSSRWVDAPTSNFIVIRCKGSNCPKTCPSRSPTHFPTISPSLSPSLLPSRSPSLSPSLSASLSPSLLPSRSPSLSPSLSSSTSPSLAPSLPPTNPPPTPSLCAQYTNYAPMYRTGNTNNEVESHLYLRYDRAAKTLHAKVIVVAGVQGLKEPQNAWLKVAGQNNLFDGNSESFKWLGENKASLSPTPLPPNCVPGPYGKICSPTSIPSFPPTPLPPTCVPGPYGETCSPTTVPTSVPTVAPTNAAPALVSGWEASVSFEATCVTIIAQIQVAAAGENGIAELSSTDVSGIELCTNKCVTAAPTAAPTSKPTVSPSL